MATIAVQKFPTVLQISGAVGANAASSGSAYCQGYSTLVGAVFTAGSTVAACGLKVEWSFNGGANWDYVSASNALVSGASTACSIGVVGNAVRVTYAQGATAASRVSLVFYLKPV